LPTVYTWVEEGASRRLERRAKAMRVAVQAPASEV